MKAISLYITDKQGVTLTHILTTYNPTERTEREVVLELADQLSDELEVA